MPIGPSPNDFSILDFLGHRFRIVRSNYEHYPTDAAAITVLKSFAYFSEYTSKFDRTSPLNILEVGVFEGGGAMMLALLFPNAKIVGIDSRAKPSGVDAYLAHPDFNRRVRFNWGVSQTDRTRIDRIISEEFGNGEIDLVIDDASHQYIQSKATFEIVFPRLCRNGIYIIEDWS